MSAREPDPAPPEGSQRLRRLQFRLALGLLAVPLAFVAYQMFFSPRIAFLYGGPDDAEWILAAQGSSSGVVVVDPTRPEPHYFEKSFDLAAVPQREVELHVRTLDGARVWVNSAEIEAAEYEAAGRRAGRRVDISNRLGVGANTLRIEVWNRLGPQLLQLWIDGLEPPVATNTSWTVSRPGEKPAFAVVADDTVRSEQSQQASTPSEVLSRKTATVGLLFAFSCGAFLMARSIPASARGRAPVLIAVTLTLGWSWLFVAKTIHSPIEFGFDTTGHLEYIDHIHEHAELPRPGLGWSTSHPPLFYLLAAELESIGDRLMGESSRAVTLRILPLLSGLGIIWLTIPFAGRVFDGDPLRVSLAVLGAGLMPMNVYMSTFVSNESLHAVFATAALWLTFVALDEPRTRPRTLAMLSAIMGLALLSKATSLLVMGLSGIFLAWKLLVVERRPLANVCANALLFLAGPVVIAGWYYATNVAEFGALQVANWARIEDRAWWQHPGFHTPAYFLSFGESFRHPDFSSYRSFWDGLYTTLWGDGLVSGRMSIASRRLQLWNSDFMALVYPFALPATVLMFYGFGRAGAAARRSECAPRQLAWLFLLTLVGFMACALVYMPLQLPAYGAAKMVFALFLVAPMAIAIAEGFAAFDRALQRRHQGIARVALYGWLGTFFALSFLAFGG